MSFFNASLTTRCQEMGSTLFCFKELPGQKPWAHFPKFAPCARHSMALGWALEQNKMPTGKPRHINNLSLVCVTYIFEKLELCVILYRRT